MILKHDGNFWELICARAALSADATMLIDEGGTRLTFSQFRDRVDDVAFRMFSLGIEGGTAVSWQLPDDHRDGGDPEAATPPVPPAGFAHDTGWVFYTSGTTAQPKGVFHSDQSVINAAWGWATRVPLSEQDITSVAFPWAHAGGPMSPAGSRTSSSARARMCPPSRSNTSSTLIRRSRGPR